MAPRTTSRRGVHPRHGGLRSGTHQGGRTSEIPGTLVSQSGFQGWSRRLSEGYRNDGTSPSTSRSDWANPRRRYKSSTRLRHPRSSSVRHWCAASTKRGPYQDPGGKTHEDIESLVPTGTTPGPRDAPGSWTAGVSTEGTSRPEWEDDWETSPSRKGNVPGESRRSPCRW